MLAQDFCYGFAIAEPLKALLRRASFVICALTPKAEALHVNPVAMFYQSKQWMFLLRAYHIGE
jgi:hypothetical protein